MNYDVKPSTIINQSYLEPVDATIRNELNHWHRLFKTIVPNGFQSIVEIRDHETGEIDYHAGILQKLPGRSGKVSGSFAQVKMDTLQKFPNLAMTGTCTIDELVNMIQTVRSDYDVSTFSNLENVCQLTRAQHEELRREIGITAYLGGIKVPFIRRVSKVKGGHADEHKDAYITFSVLTGEGDLHMCCYILRELQHALQTSEPNTAYTFDLSELKGNPIAYFALKMNGAHETIVN